jgi:NADPH2:quinone reductase
MFREIANLIRADVLATEIGKSFPIDAIGDAVRETEQVGRHGKVLLKTGSR